jgi:hypothetical protein
MYIFSERDSRRGKRDGNYGRVGQRQDHSSPGLKEKKINEIIAFHDLSDFFYIHNLQILAGQRLQTSGEVLLNGAKIQVSSKRYIGNFFLIQVSSSFFNSGLLEALTSVSTLTYTICCRPHTLVA